MPLKIAWPKSKKAAEGPVVYEPIAPTRSHYEVLEARVSELEGDLVRIVELIVMGDIDSAKFKEILSKRQGKAKP